MDITRDVMRMLDDRASLTGIRAYVDATYQRFGAPTPTPLPPTGR